MEDLINKIQSKNWDIFLVLAISFISLVPFTVVTQLQRTREFINFIFLPILGYILIFYVIKKRDLQLEGSNLRIFLMYAIAIRIFLLIFPVGLSDDVYRYIWDGQVQHAGFNPYIYSPDALELIFLREEWWPMINNPNISTPYPPLSQILFWIVTLPDFNLRISIFIIRVVMTIFDLLIMSILLQLLDHYEIPRYYIILYGLSPLVLFEFSGNGHNDAMALFFMLFSLYMAIKHSQKWYGSFLSAISLGLGILSKFFPIVVLPFLIHQWKVRDYLVFLITMLFSSLPYFSNRIIPYFTPGQMSFIRYFRFNESLFRIYDSFIQQSGFGTELTSRIIFLVLFVLIFFYYWGNYFVKDENKDLFSLRSIQMLIMIGLLLGPDVQPWYILWFLPLSIIFFDLTGIVWSLTVLLSYEVYSIYDMTGIWRESTIILLMEYIPVYLFFTLEYVFGKDIFSIKTFNS